MKVWPVQDAKARFSEMLDACVSHGPQLVSKRGVEAAVLVPVADWKRLNEQARQTFKDLLLTDVGRVGLDIPARAPSLGRPTPEL